MAPTHHPRPVNIMHTGCGHIRLMLDPATSEYYGVAADVQAVTNCVGDVKDSECISAKVIAARMIENYFKCVTP